MKALASIRRREQGSAILFLIILLLVVAGGWYFLNNLRRTSQAEGLQFAREVIERCVFQHDAKFLRSVVAADRRLAVPPAMDEQFIAVLTKLGIPERNYQITGELQFENYFFAPSGVYKTILTFPDRHGTFYVSVKRPSGIWLVADYGIIWERPPEFSGLPGPAGRLAASQPNSR